MDVNKHLLRTALVVGLLSAIGPFAIDMYLPALPAIGKDFGASASQVQASLMAFMIATAFGQLVYGPVSDIVGRKPPLYFGLVLFVIGAVGSALAPNIETLVVLRFIQGVGACAPMALPRAIVRDNYTGAEAAQLMSLLMLVFSISPILAPLAGSLTLEVGDWRLVFWIVALAGVLGLVLLALGLEETRPAHARAGTRLTTVLRGYLAIMADLRFVAISLIGAFGLGGFMAYLGTSSFLMIDRYGLTPTQFSLAFALNAIAFVVGSQLTSRLVRLLGLSALVRASAGAFAAILLGLFVLTLVGIDRLDVLIVLLFLAFVALGAMLPSTGVLAMEDQGELAGTAAAVMGTLQQLLAAVVMVVAGLWFDGTGLPMTAIMAVCGLAALALALLTPGPGEKAGTLEGAAAE